MPHDDKLMIVVPWRCMNTARTQQLIRRTSGLYGLFKLHRLDALCEKFLHTSAGQYAKDADKRVSYTSTCSKKNVSL